MKILLLGGTGFIGQKIQAQRPDWEWVSVGSKKHNLTNSHGLDKLVDKYDVVINAAGFYGGLPFNNKYQQEILFCNTAIINNVARLVDKIQPKKFVNIGSGCVYHRIATGKLLESDIGPTDYHPSIQYSAMTKGWLLQVAQNLGVPWEYLVLSNVYGPDEHLSFERSHFIGSLINKVKNSTGVVNMLGDGTGVRDFIYIEDTAEAVCRYCELKQATNSVSNISTGLGVSIREITKRLVNISGQDLDIVWGNPTDNGVLYKVLDNSKMLLDIKYQPQIDLTQGLTKTWQWIQNKKL
jgi:GDP-L-fucose synthase